MGERVREKGGGRERGERDRERGERQREERERTLLVALTNLVIFEKS
jgi:hypothetical protein